MMAALAEPRETLPDAVPVAELGRQRPPSDVVDGETMQGFEKLAIVAALVAPPGPAGPEHIEGDRPVLFGHLRQHGRPSKSQPPMNHRKSDLGIPSRYISRYPSTRPRTKSLAEVAYSGLSESPLNPEILTLSRRLAGPLLGHPIGGG